VRRSPRFSRVETMRSRAVAIPAGRRRPPPCACCAWGCGGTAGAGAAELDGTISVFVGGPLCGTASERVRVSLMASMANKQPGSDRCHQGGGAHNRT
jgi:hypothetical protein